jgi:hypothetical protein
MRVGRDRLLGEGYRTGCDEADRSGEAGEAGEAPRAHLHVPHSSDATSSLAFAAWLSAIMQL